MSVKHATADVFVFWPKGILRIGLVPHPLWGKWVTPGGHVEPYENPAEAARRELREESGITDARFLAPLPPRFVLRAGFPAERVVPSPWLIVEHQIPADNGLLVPHVHVDFQYVAVVDVVESSLVPEFCWFSEADLAELDLFDAERITTVSLFAHLRGVLSCP
jgi:8-oxo-dGTP pyrophosphatase MutT (NUDIX family)